MKHFYAEICKVDDEKRMVYGYASTEALDVQGEIVTKQAMAEALEDYMRFANIREMHQPSAVGVAKSVEMDDKGTFISAHVVDDSAWSKVKAGVYKGFSIGGKAIEKVDNVINALRLTEISLVDRPANPEALITLWKADAATSDAKPSDEEAAVTQLAQMLDQGAISAQRLVALAKADAETATKAVTTAQAVATEKQHAHQSLVAQRIAGMAGELASELKPGEACFFPADAQHLFRRERFQQAAADQRAAHVAGHAERKAVAEPLRGYAEHLDQHKAGARDEHENPAIGQRAGPAAGQGDQLGHAAMRADRAGGRGEYCIGQQRRPVPGDFPRGFLAAARFGWHRRQLEFTVRAIPHRFRQGAGQAPGG